MPLKNIDPASYVDALLVTSIPASDYWHQLPLTLAINFVLSCGPFYAVWLGGEKRLGELVRSRFSWVPMVGPPSPGVTGPTGGTQRQQQLFFC